MFQNAQNFTVFPALCLATTDFHIISCIDLWHTHFYSIFCTVFRDAPALEARQEVVLGELVLQFGGVITWPGVLGGTPQFGDAHGRLGRLASRPPVLQMKIEDIITVRNVVAAR